MRIRNIDFPDPLVQSIRKKRLVVFVGAGVSLDPPSGLPGFEALATEIAAGSGGKRLVVEEEDGTKTKEPLDRFLGRLEHDFGVDVYAKTKTEIAKEGSRPNRLHKSIVSLFGPDAPLRIVTTNFDMHLEGALEELDVDLPRVYQAPALPLGNDFDGIVYVHGRLEPNPRQIVITDGDFGRAYLTEGWARRFLSQLFESFDVLFVGYSHNDPVVSYLARGLPPDADTKRYSLTEDGRSGHWKLLGIEPIEYAKGEHGEVVNLLEKLVEFCSRGAADHEQRVKEIITQSAIDGIETDDQRKFDALPLLKAHERDYLLFILRDELLRHLFFLHADGATWLVWMDEVQQLNHLFEFSCDDSVLVYWFAQDLLEKRGDVALRILAKQKNHIRAPVLQLEIARRLGQDMRALSIQPETGESAEVSEEKLCRALCWVAALVGRLEPLAKEDLALFLKEIPFTEQTRSFHLALFEIVTRPIPEIHDRFSFRGGMRIEVHFDHYAKLSVLRDLWEEAYSQNLSLLAEGLIPILAARFLLARHTLLASGQASHRYDPLVEERSDIGGYTIGDDDSVFNTMINAARDCLVYLNKEKPGKARSIIEDWITSDSLVLRRIAVHGMQSNSQLSSSQGFRLIKSTPGLLRDFYADHELLQTLRHFYAQAREPLKRQILNAKLRALKERYQPDELPTQSAEDLAIWQQSAWMTFLSELQQVDPGCQLLDRKIQEAQTEHPGFEPPPRHTGLNPWTGSETGTLMVQAPSPVSREQILKMVPDQVLMLRVELAEETSENGGKESLSLQETISEAAGENFEWGRSLAKHLADQEKHGRRDVWEALFRAWQGGEYSPQEVAQLLDFLLNQETVLLNQQSEVTSFLRERFQSGRSRIRPEVLKKAIGLASKIWPLLGPSPLFSGELTVEARIHPMALLARFVLSALSRLRNDYNQTLEKSIDLLELMNQIVDSVDTEGVWGVIPLGEELLFLRSVSPEWTQQRLIPLLDWSRNSTIARAVWTGYFQKRPLEPLSSPVALPHLGQIFRHLEEFDSGTQKRIHSHVIRGLADEVNAVDSSWFQAYLINTSDKQRAELWSHLRSRAHSAARQDQDDRGQHFDAIWESWAGELATRRLSDNPSLGPVEWQALFELCPYLNDYFPTVVNLVWERDQPMESELSTQYAHRLASEDDLDKRWFTHLWKHPNALGKYLYRAMAETIRVYYRPEIARIIRRLKEEGKTDSDLLERLRHRYVEIGGSADDLE